MRNYNYKKKSISGIDIILNHKLFDQIRLL